MQIDVGASIAALLYEQDAVIIPGLGAITTKYRPAEIQAVEGKVLPPSKELNFNKNLTMDDGILINHLRKKYGASFAEIQRAVSDYVKQVVEAIDNQSIVQIPQVGRLYRDYEKKLKFLPEDTNFNVEAYGLPVVQFYPVIRQERIPAPQKAPAITAKQTTRPVGKRFAVWLQRNLAVTSIIAVLGIAAVVYWAIQREKPAAPQEEIASVPTSRFNVRPSLEAIKADSQLIQTDTGINSEENIPFDSENATVKPQQKYCIIRVGLFSDQDNVKRLVEKLYEKGFEPLTQPSGNLTMVGVQMSYESQSDIDKAVQTIQKEFKTKPAVIKK